MSNETQRVAVALKPPSFFDTISPSDLADDSIVLVTQAGVTRKITKGSLFSLLVQKSLSTGVGAAQGFSLESGNVILVSDTSYTVTSAANGKTLVFENGSAITVTLNSSLPSDFSCMVIQKGAGQVSFSASGINLRNYSSHTKMAGQYAMATLWREGAGDLYLGGQTGA